MTELHEETTETHQHHGVRGTAPFILGGMSAGHGVFHWFSQSFLVMLPEVRDAFSLSEIQIGAITSVREIMSGAVALPGGVFTDLARRQCGLVLAFCMMFFGVGWVIMGMMVNILRADIATPVDVAPSHELLQLLSGLNPRQPGFPHRCRHHQLA